MQVYKFGGGIIRNANAIEKLTEILTQNKSDKVIVVLSAMNKTTNKLEQLISEFLHNKNQFYVSFNQIKDFHLQVINELKFNNSETVINRIIDLFEEVNSNFIKYQKEDFDFLYDQIVCYGEIISTTLISAYLNDRGIANHWFDIRKYLKTTDLFRNAVVQELVSKDTISQYINNCDSNLIITQGFIASTNEGHSTTLGREGSDYTASLLGNFINAERVVVWKDVKGIYNADPKNYDEAVLIPELNYKDALGLTNLGAKVLHHKSITPLEELNIPLEVRLFDLPIQLGSCIYKQAEPIAHIPIIIHRYHKYLLKITSKSNPYLSKEEKEKIFSCIRNNNMVLNFQANINQIQYLCLNNFPELILKVMVQLSKFYHIEVFDQVCMIKVKNGNQEIINHLTLGKDLLISDLQDDVQYIFHS